MKVYKVFIASSGELKPEREELESLLTSLNKSYNQLDIYIEPVVWEKLLLDIGNGRKQDYFNKKLKECDIVLFMFWKKLGEYTKEEFFNYL